MSDNHGIAVGRHHLGLKAKRREGAGAPVRGPAAIGRECGIGRHARDSDQLKQASEGLIAFGVKCLKDVGKVLAHGSLGSYGRRFGKDSGQARAAVNHRAF